MGQQEVYNFLSNNKNKWFLSKEIWTGLGLSSGSVTNSLKKLKESKAIKFKKTKNNKFKYKF